MKRHSFIKSAALAALLSTLNPQLSTLLAQGTAFSVQGRLENSGSPVNGTNDVKLSLYDVASGGAPVKGPITNTAVAVNNGIFNVAPDFGAGAFTGAPRWLEIAACPSGSGSFTSLGPRQQVLPTPYAIYAGTAATASNVTSGAAVKSLNGLKDILTLQGTGGVNVSDDGHNTITISGNASGGGSSSLWSLSGSTAYYPNNVRVGAANSADGARFTVSTPALDGEDFGLEHTDGIVRLVTYLDGRSAGQAAGWLGTFSITQFQ